MAIRTVPNSLRFDGASAYLSRTPGSAGNRRTWTWSAWIKRGLLGGSFGLFSAKQVKDDITGFYLTSADKLTFLERPATVTQAQLTTTMVFRDPTAWYHIVVAVDTTQATASERIRFYVNGVRTTQHDTTTWPSLNYEFAYINAAQEHRIGAFQDNTPLYFDGYMAEVHFLDGQALDASAFGELDGSGQWLPKVTSFTSTQYGLNGFYLDFVDGSNTTAATLGKDTAPTGTGHTAANNYTPTGFNTKKSTQLEIITNGIHVPNVAAVNTNAATYVAWYWKKGTTPGFDIVRYTGTGANRTVAHGLGVAPAMYITKDIGGSSHFSVYHRSLGATQALLLSSNVVADTNIAYWNNTAPTNSVFSLGTGDTNINGRNMIAYLWAEVPGFSRFGSYTGNGSADGPFVWCGFRPRWVLIKRSDTTASGWVLFDTLRDPINPAGTQTYPHLSNVEDYLARLDLVSNGFKIRIDSSGTGTNATGGNYVFAAFAERPFKYGNAR